MSSLRARSIWVVVAALASFVTWAQQPIHAPDARQAISPKALDSSSAASRSTDRRFQVQGTLLDALNDKPLANVQVALTQAGDDTSRHMVMTDENGIFRFFSVASGDYSLQAEGAGFPLQDLGAGQGVPGRIHVGSGNRASGLVFRVRPEALISGTVTDEHGDPVRSAKITLFATDAQGGMRTAAQTQTNDLGMYRLPHLLEGKYVLAVDAQPWYAQPQIRTAPPGVNADLWVREEYATFHVIYPTTYYPATDKPDNAGAIELLPGQHFAADVVLTPAPAP